MRLLVHLLAPLLRGVAAALIAMLLSVLLGPSRGRAAAQPAFRSPSHAADGQASSDVVGALHHDDAPHKAPLSQTPPAPDSDTEQEGEDLEDEGGDDTSAGDVPAFAGAHAWPSSLAHGSAASCAWTGAVRPLRTRLAEGPDAPPPRR